METTKILKLIDSMQADIDLLMQKLGTSSGSSGGNGGGSISSEDLAKINECLQTLETHRIQLQNLTTNINANSQELSQLSSDFGSISYLTNTNTQNISTISSNLQNAISNISLYAQGLTEVASSVQQISSTVGTHSQTLTQLSSDLEELSTTISQLENSGSQSQIQDLQRKVNLLMSEIDHFYVGQSFSDYPAGTILKTYDFTEMHCGKTFTSSYETRPVFFHAEQGSCGNIVITLKYLLTQIAQNVVFTTYVNNQVVNQQNISHNTFGEEQTLTIYLNDINLNTEDSSNSVYVKIDRENSGTNYVQLLYQKTEIFAPNADIVNKICPFYAIYLLGKYYLTDCSSGFLKYASIEPQNMNNMQNLDWVETSIPALSCIVGSSFAQYGSTYYGNESALIFLKLNPNNLLYCWGTLENNIEFSNYSDIFQADHHQSVNTNRIFLFVNKTCNLKQLTINVTTNSGGVSSGEAGFAAQVSGLKLNRNQTNSVSNAPFVAIRPNGECYLRTSISSSATTKKLLLGHASFATVYLDTVNASNDYSLRVFLKRYEKIIEYKVHYTANNGFVLTEQNEIGNYDNFFLMPNNDYFVVRNGKLSYHKFPLE